MLQLFFVVMDRVVLQQEQISATVEISFPIADNVRVELNHDLVDNNSPVEVCYVQTEARGWSYLYRIFGVLMDDDEVL
jgi:hypothetical protein